MVKDGYLSTYAYRNYHKPIRKTTAIFLRNFLPEPFQHACRHLNQQAPPSCQSPLQELPPLGISEAGHGRSPTTSLFWSALLPMPPLPPISPRTFPWSSKWGTSTAHGESKEHSGLGKWTNSSQCVDAWSDLVKLSRLPFLGTLTTDVSFFTWTSWTEAHVKSYSVLQKCDSAPGIQSLCCKCYQLKPFR